MIGASQLTYSGIGLAVFGQQLCLPLPGMLFLMTAGALAARGDLHLSLVLLVGVAGCLAADGIWFWLGRRWGSSVIRVVCSFTSDPRGSRERSHQLFVRWGLRLLVAAKFIPGLDGISPPLAGAEGASVIGFLAYDAAGSLLWCVAYVLLGYVFSSQLGRVILLAAHFGTAVAVVVGVPLLLFAAWRLLQLVQMVRHLRLRRIGPALLEKKMKEDHQLAVFDLLYYEARDGLTEGIPGSVRVNPTRLRKGPSVTIPDGVSVVLYCSSRNDLTSARVAQMLHKRGFDDVWVLEGGLAAWIQEGLPVTTDLKTPEDVAARLGIVLPAGA